MPPILEETPEPTAVVEQTAEQTAGSTPEPTEEEKAAAAAAAAEGQITVQIGDQPPEEEDKIDGKPAPDWLKDLRKNNREQTRRIKELERERDSLKQTTAAAQEIVVGAKPTLEGCDYEAKKYEAELEAWHARKRQADDAKAVKEREAQQAEQTWNQKVQTYNTAKAALKVSDFKDAEEQAQALLSVTQQGIILSGADKPEVLIYALGKNPAKAKELAAITDPVKFSFAVAKLEAQLKITPRSGAPAPERTLTGGASGASSVDNQLEKLRAAAEKSGDYSQVLAYKKQMKQKAAQR